MPATTIKLEADLVKKVTALKPKDESISGYVRELIEKEHRAREHRALLAVARSAASELRDGASNEFVLLVGKAAELQAAAKAHER